MTKYIEVGPILGLSGKSVRVAKRDDDDEVIIENPHEEDLQLQRAELMDGDTLEVLRSIIFFVPKEIQKVADSKHGYKLWNSVQAARARVEERKNGSKPATRRRRPPAETEGANEGAPPDSVVSPDVPPNAVHGAVYIKLREPVYEWLHRLLERAIPLTVEYGPQGAAEAKKDGIEPMPFKRKLWGMSSDVVTEQLKDIDERKPLDQLGADEGEDD